MNTITPTSAADLDMRDRTSPVPPATVSELATALLISDNILRDIRLSMDEGILAERAAYHRSHIDRATTENHLILCNRCRQREKGRAPSETPASETPASETPASAPWPLGINSLMDAHAADIGLSHWSCWSPQDNRLWVRRDGRVHECFRDGQDTQHYPDELRAIDARHPRKAPAIIRRARAGGIHVERPAGAKAHAKAKAEMAARMASAPAPGGFQPSISPSAYPHSFAGCYEFTGSEDTMAGLLEILTAMGASPPPDAEISAIQMERPAVLHARVLGTRMRERLIASGILSLALESPSLIDISFGVHRLDRALALLNTALGNTTANAN